MVCSSGNVSTKSIIIQDAPATRPSWNDKKTKNSSSVSLESECVSEHKKKGERKRTRI